MPEPVVPRDNPAESRFEVEIDGQRAVIAYRRIGDILDLAHTVVPPELSGRGIGSAMALAVLRDARDTGQKVRLSCSFLDAYYDQHREMLSGLRQA